MALAITLALPTTASAVEIGSDHSGGGSQGWFCASPSVQCVVIQDTVRGDPNNNVVPGNGRITRFSVRRADGQFAFYVLRGAGTVVGSTSLIDPGPVSDSVTQFTLTPPINVQAGDFIAILLDNGSAIGVRDAATDPGGTLLREYNTSLVEQDNGAFEAYLSATFEPTPVSPPVNPLPTNPIVTAIPDPLAALKAGKRPTARIAGGTVSISKRGAGSLTLTNPNGYVLKGTLSLAAGKLKLGKARVNLAANATKAFKFKLSRKALRRLRKKRRLRATATAKLKGPVGKTGTIRKRLTLKAPAKPKRKKKRKSGGGGNTPSSNLWVARNGNTGAYDDFKFRLDGNTITHTGTSLLFVSCFEIGGGYRSSFSYEIFNLLGPWQLGNQSTTQKRQSRAVNVLVGSGERTITYTFTSSRSGNKITGQRKMSFSDSQYNPFDNSISSVFCSGSQNYEAIPG